MQNYLLKKRVMSQPLGDNALLVNLKTLRLTLELLYNHGIGLDRLVVYAEDS